MTAEDLHNLGVKSYYSNEATNPKKVAYDYYEKAAKKGLDLAMLRLGEMFFFGDGVAKSKSKGIYWMKNALVNAEHYNDLYVINPTSDVWTPLEKFVYANS